MSRYYTRLHKSKHRRPAMLQFILTLCCLFFSASLFATQTVNFGAAPGWVTNVEPPKKQPSLRDIQDGYYLQLFEREINVATGEAYQHIIRDIVTETGVQGGSNLSIDYNPDYERLTVHDVSVIRNGQKINRLNKGGFKVVANEQDLSRFIYNGNYSAYVILEDIRRGDKIEYSYTIAGRNPVFEGKFFTTFALQGTDPIGHIHYTLLLPSSRTLNFKYFNKAATPVVTRTGANTRYEWNLPDVPGRHLNSNVPADFNPLPRIEISEFNGWKEVADWGSKINNATTGLTGAVAARVQELRDKHRGDKEGLFRAIVNVVQNEVRYMGVEIGSYSHKANLPAKVLTQRYGDCKDKSLLLATMLRGAGFEASIALVNSYLGDAITERLPSPSMFNHAVVRARVDNKDVWVDATYSEQGGAGTNIYFPDYRNALLLEPGSNELVSIPTLDGGTIKSVETFDMTDLQQTAALTVYTTYTGSKADDMRSTLASRGKGDLEKSYLDYYAGSYPDVELQDSLEVQDDTKANSLIIIERYSIPHTFEYDSATKNYGFSVYARTMRDMLPEVEKLKESPISLRYPNTVNYTVHLVAPIAWDLKPERDIVDGNAYRFTRDVSSGSNQCTIEFELTFKKDRVEPGDIRRYESDRKKLVNELFSYSLTYTPGGGAGPTGISYLAILDFLFIAAGCAYVAVRIYKRPTRRPAPAHIAARPIGSWLILPGIYLVTFVLRTLYYLINTGFFGKALWAVMGTQEHPGHATFLLGIEFVANIVAMSLATLCFVLYIKKRDILPRYISYLYIGTIAFIVLDAAYAGAIGINVFDMKQTLRALLAACIWVPVFRHSSRVKETFIETYADLPEEQEYSVYDKYLPEVVEPQDNTIDAEKGSE